MDAHFCYNGVCGSRPVEVKARIEPMQAYEFHDMASEDLVRSAAVIVVASHSLSLYLHYRQQKHLRKHEAPSQEAGEVMDRKKYRMTRLLAIEKNKFLLMKEAFTLARDLMVTCLPIYHFVWTKTRHLVGALGVNDRFDITHHCLFSSTIAFANSAIYLPWELYSTAYIETKYGLSHQAPDDFLRDQLLTMLRLQLTIFAAVLGLNITSAILGSNAFLFIGVFVSVCTVLFILLYPNCVAPLFDDFISLPQGSLRGKIEMLAQSLNFPLNGVLIADGAKRLTHGDVYLLGLSKNRSIVLDKDFYDAVETSPAYQKRSRSVGGDLPGYTEEGVLALLCHEFGHWKSHHNSKHLLLTQLHLLVAFVIFAAFVDDKNLYRAFGFGDEQPLLIGILIIAGSLYHPIDEFLDKASVLISRVFEFEADSFAQRNKLGPDLSKAMIMQDRRSWQFPVEDWMFSCAFNTIPLPIERIRALRHDD